MHATLMSEICGHDYAENANWFEYDEILKRSLVVNFFPSIRPLDYTLQQFANNFLPTLFPNCKRTVT